MGLLNGLLGLALVGFTITDAKINRIPSRPCLRKGYTDTIYDHSLLDFWGDDNITLSKYEGKQEPGANSTEIMNGISYVRPGNGFRPNFQLFSKIDVNGDKEHPLYTYLKKHCPTTRDGFANKNDLYYDPIRNWDVRWNWEKFLIDRNGLPLTRYDASTHPDDIEGDIRQLINEG